METNKNSAPAGVLTEAQIIAAWDALWSYHGHEPCKVGHIEFARAVEREVLATRASVDLSGLTRYGWTIDPENDTFGIKADGDYYLVSDVRALLATSAAEGGEQASVPSVGSIDTPEFSRLLGRLIEVVIGTEKETEYGTTRAALITHIDAHLARQAQSEPVAWLRYWAAQRYVGHGNVEVDDGLEVCQPGDVGVDGVRAFPVYAPLAAQMGSAQAAQADMTAAARDVLAERQRQVSAEGWTPEGDDGYDAGELSLAASCYALAGDAPRGRSPNDWPWDESWWKPSSDRRNLVKAGALILAEIERIDRAAMRTSTTAGEGGA